MSTGWLFDERFLLHETGPNHPERPDRLRAIVTHLRSIGLLERLTPIEFQATNATTVASLHDPDYIRRIRTACQAGETWIDAPDSAICPASYEVALLAVGAVVAAVDAVIVGRIRNAFCVVRPPGHHAERDRSMGFCLFNNVALAANHALSHPGLTRVAIVDFDVHHGNGTQHLFEHRDDVLFISLHQDPTTLYPGTGYASETGFGPGKGFTVNLPVNPGSGDEVYQAFFESRVIPTLDAYQPHMLLISAGFDAAAEDPLANTQLTPQCFAWMTRQLQAVAQRHAQGRTISVLEGGYDLASLAHCVAAVIEVLLEG